MGIKNSILSVLVGYVLHVSCLSSEQLLLDKQMSEEEALHFAVTNWEEEVARWCPTVESVRARYWAQLNTGRAVRFVVICDDETNKPLRVRITSRMVKPAAILYERAVPRELLDQYELSVGSDAHSQDSCLTEPSS